MHTHFAQFSKEGREYPVLRFGKMLVILRLLPGCSGFECSPEGSRNVVALPYYNVTFRWRKDAISLRRLS